MTGSGSTRRGSDAEECRPLTNGFAHPAEVAARKVPKTTVHDPQAVGRGGAAEIVLLDQRHLQAAESRVPGDARAVDAAAHHDHVVYPAGEPDQVAFHGVLAGDGRRSSGAGVRDRDRMGRTAPGSDPLADAIRASVRRAQVHDDLSHEPETHQLYPEGDQQHGEEQQRPVGDALARRSVPPAGPDR